MIGGDDLDSRLRRLPAHDVEPHAGERIRRLALELLQHESTARPLHRRAWRLLEPVLSTGVVGTYLTWMVWTLIAVGR